ncbi:GspH/FimT family pseudopilin [Stutzerimonas degradans]|uniref:Type II secretion system protein H n=1 Tax=Stutzerimonas degradans TaxID=2968968 RepID=A0A8E2U529_9GAMM|nr:GspH/FimT family pseudopilin [Stutzerimonas degradans]MCQ4274876.1 GspH/FimT family pseudopilin [Stutzerimonas degradans]PNF78403.1 prepilin-type cleavage/methylation domain-containing protein [Stutzerimonas degradans]QPT20264.1 GspH/FimT family pseudopilin [Stutzerimonas degradans]
MHHNRGFTLIELLVTVAILAILLGLAVPSFRSLIENNRTQTAANNLTGALQFARSEAIKRGVATQICRRNGNACANATTWGDGWLVKISGGDVLQVWDATANGTTVTGPAETLTFRPNGLLANALDDNEEFVVSITDCSNQPQYTIALSATGRVSSSKGNCE